MNVANSEDLKCNILEIASGAVKERIDLEMENIVENILNLNTEAKKKRQLIITIDFMPSEDRSAVGIAAQVKSKLLPLSSIPTLIYVGTDKKGQMAAVEAVTQTPGQVNFNGSMQDDPKVIKIGKSDSVEKAKNQENAVQA